MSTYSVQDAKNDLTAVLHNTQLNQIANLDGVFNRTARQLLLDVDPQETKRTLEFVNPIFNTVFDYPIADDVKGNKIIDIRPQVRRLPRDVWSQAYNQAFDVWKQNSFVNADMFTMNFNTGIKTIRINAPYLNSPVILNYADDLTDNGTWSSTSNFTNLGIDSVNFVGGSGSIIATLPAGNNGGSIANSTMTPIDLTDLQNQASLFFWIYFTDASLMDNMNLLIGSSATDYYAGYGLSTNQQGTAFVNGWNLLQVPWQSLAVNGTPDITAINYIAVNVSTIAPLATDQIFRFNLFDAILGSVLEYEYYSDYLFRDATTGAFQPKVTDDSNLINLATESYNLFFNLLAFLVTQQQQGLDATFYDGNFFGQQYQAGLARYKAMYKSEVQKPQTSYYAQPNKSYGRFLGRGRF